MAVCPKGQNSDNGLPVKGTKFGQLFTFQRDKTQSTVHLSKGQNSVNCLSVKGALLDCLYNLLLAVCPISVVVYLNLFRPGPLVTVTTWSLVFQGDIT